MPHRMTLLILAGLLAGCADRAESEAAKLSLACQVSKCDCISDTVSFFDEEPVQWKQDGTASCPEGYHLRRLTPTPEKTP